MTVRSRRKIRTRRTSAVAPIISSMLLISITVGAFALVWGTTNSYLSNQRFGTLQQMKERIAIEEVYFFDNATGSYIGLYIRNSGKVELIGQDIGINGSILSKTTPGSLTLRIGEAGWINGSLAWSPGETYVISIASQRGSRAESIHIAN